MQALDEANVKIDYISGASSGSIVATMYCLGYTPFNILHMFNSYCKQISEYDKLIPFKIMGMLFTGKLRLKGMIKNTNLESILKGFCSQKDVIDILDVKMPLAIPTVDIKTGEIIYLSLIHI